VLAAATAARLVTSLADAQSVRGDASVVLTGGGIGIAVLRALAQTPARHVVDWSRVDVWWGDERFVGPDSADRNDVQALEAIGPAITFDPSRVHRMGSTAAYDTPEAAAEAYVAALHTAGGGQVPAFDVLLLGMGPEGHMASIFPQSPAARDGRAAFAVRDCPKPPPTRVSLGFGAIQSARAVWLVVTGTGKAAALAQVVGGAAQLDVPAAGAVGVEESLVLADLAALDRC
jgi:6-phosphogluconolactonase